MAYLINIYIYTFLQDVNTFKTPGSDFRQICLELTEVEISPDEIELAYIYVATCFHTAMYSVT